MKTLRLISLSAAVCAVAAAQSSSPLTFNVTDPSGSQPVVQLASTYQFPSTAEGSSSPLFLEVVNSSANTVYLVGAYVANASNSSIQNPNFSTSGSFSNVTLQPGDFANLIVQFAPHTSGPIAGYFQAAYQIEQGCTLGSSTAPCSTQIANVSTLSGNATGADLVLSYLLSGGVVYLQPSNTTPVSFGNVSLGATGSITFTLSNNAPQSVQVPALSVTSAGNLFQLDTSALPTTIAATSAATFKVSFAPILTGVVNATLNIGNDSYSLQATGVTPIGINALVVSYLAAGGTITLVQAGTTISLGQTVIGSSSSLSFTVTNPSASNSAISVPTLGVTGSGFTLSGVPTVPLDIQPGGSITFKVVFDGSAAGNYTGTLAIGSLSFSLTAQTTGTLPSPFTFYVHDTTGVLPDTPLSSIYQLASTAQGSSTPLVLKVVNTSQSVVYFTSPLITTTASAAVQSTSFSITGFFTALTMPVGGSTVFTVNFSPLTTGTITGYLQVGYQIEQTGCNFTSTNPATQCPSGTSAVTTLVGTATAPVLTLSYTNSSGTQVPLQPSSSTALDFGNVSLSANTKIAFTLANQSAVSVATPAISLQTLLNIATAFTLDTTALPASIPAQSSAAFTVTFAPGQIGISSGTLLVGSNSYALQGGGIVVGDDDSLQISYTDSTGVRGLPQAATPISFGQIVPGSSTGAVLTFAVLNPTTSFNAVSVSAVTVTGADFTIGSPPAPPISIQPGASITFTVTFNAAASGTYTGTITIGSRQFSLTGQAVVSPIPAISLQLSAQPLTSRQQVNVVVQFASPAAVPAVGTISMQFTPSISNVTDDPAVVFVANNGRQLSLKVAAGAQAATYNGQSNLAFQTGTTEGAIAFTVNFANTAPFTQSFTIPPAAIQITAATAVRQSPNLVVTVNGYDNTYSAGALSFTFYDTSGNAIGSPVTVNEAASFQQLFFNNNTAGGAFSLQASFPVNGNVANVGSVGVTMTNSAGQTSVNEVFQ